MLGLYLSFLIRNVSVDFQESPWIFGSVVVVLAGCLLILPMSYMVEMRASTYYVFLATCLIICTILIMCLMLVPKLFRLKDVAQSAPSGSTSGKSRNSVVSTKPMNLANVSETDDGTSHDAARRFSQNYRVKPVQNGYTIANNSSTAGDDGSTTTNH